MKQHQNRVINESVELGIKLENILAFFQTDDYHSLTEKEQKLLELQVDVMEVYYEVLNKRIELFTN